MKNSVNKENYTKCYIRTKQQKYNNSLSVPWAFPLLTVRVLLISPEVWPRLNLESREHALGGHIYHTELNEGLYESREAKLYHEYKHVAPYLTKHATSTNIFMEPRMKDYLLEKILNHNNVISVCFHPFPYSGYFWWLDKATRMKYVICDIKGHLTSKIGITFYHIFWKLVFPQSFWYQTFLTKMYTFWATLIWNFKKGAPLQTTKLQTFSFNIFIFHYI